MGLIKCNIVFLFITLLSASPVFSEWNAPNIVVQSSWGNGQGQFGIDRQDTADLIPERIYVGFNSRLVVEDLPNGRTKVIANGSLVKDFNCVESGSDVWNEECNILGDYLFTNKDGNIWTKYDAKYLLTGPTGELLATYDEKPLEFGNVTYNRRATSDNKYDTTIQYEDMTYRVVLDNKWQNYVRDQSDYLYFYDSYTAHDPVSDDTTVAWFVAKFDPCGKRIAKFMMPVSEYEPLTPEQEEMPVSIRHEVRNEYGPPVIGPDGSVYAYKRTPDTYSILKWEWVDDPSDPQAGPEPPANLAIQASLDGLLVSWGASPQDPGCVDGYEVERATSSDGIYSTIGSTDAGILRYNDPTILPGETVYYKVRAKSGGEYSDYTAVASGKRP